MVSRAGYVRVVGMVLVCALVTVACTSGTEPTTSTVVTTVPTTSTTTTTTVPETTTTVSVDQRIAEVTEIVRELDFGWFEAIYLKDEQALLDVIALQESFDAGIDAMSDDSFFVAAQTREAVIIEIHKILIDRQDCLAVSYHGDWTAFLGPDGQEDETAAYWPRPLDGRWRSAYLGDVWEEACNEFTRENQLP